MVLPTTGGRYRNVFDSESVTVKQVDSVRSRVLVLRDAGREWMDIREFNARFKPTRYTGR
jgi:hypothetical protein